MPDEIIVKEFQTHVLNGDRATKHTNHCFYEVWFKGALLQKFTGYDNLWCTYKKASVVKAEALEFAAKLGEYTFESYVKGDAPWVLKT